jgi:hypothetical protein
MGLVRFAGTLGLAAAALVEAPASASSALELVRMRAKEVRHLAASRAREDEGCPRRVRS